MRLFLLLGSCLLPALALAQTTVSGRVLDAKTDAGVAGATILQPGTTNGVASDSAGHFTLLVPSSPDSITLRFSMIGYLAQQRRVAVGSASTVRLAPDTIRYDYDAEAARYSLVGIGLISGTRYAPFGAYARLDGHRLIHFPLSATLSYQTNFGHNHSLLLGLQLPPILEHGRVTIHEKAEYQQLQAVAANLRFSTYLATMELQVYRIGRVRLPTVLLGIGHGRYQPLQPDAPAAEQGYGYRFGLNHEFLPYPFRLFGTLQATRWPTFWQWQSRVAHPFANKFQVGIEANYLRQYAELSITLTRFFY